ncbi:hypothetical protein TWF696_008607 [Orbilia brochopaga]|uniref:Uncharacterized protein n=1 Tax=Orbilia brochopaga TaxID=3140254 RepID=A0AAV9UKY2_9PEZI
MGDKKKPRTPEEEDEEKKNFIRGFEASSMLLAGLLPGCNHSTPAKRPRLETPLDSEEEEQAEKKEEKKKEGKKKEGKKKEEKPKKKSNLTADERAFMGHLEKFITEIPADPGLGLGPEEGPMRIMKVGNYALPLSMYKKTARDASTLKIPSSAETTPTKSPAPGASDPSPSTKSPAPAASSPSPLAKSHQPPKRSHSPEPTPTKPPPAPYVPPKAVELPVKKPPKGKKSKRAKKALAKQRRLAAVADGSSDSNSSSASDTDKDDPPPRDSLLPGAAESSKQAALSPSTPQKRRVTEIPIEETEEAKIAVNPPLLELLQDLSIFYKWKPEEFFKLNRNSIRAFFHIYNREYMPPVRYSDGTVLLSFIHNIYVQQYWIAWVREALMLLLKEPYCSMIKPDDACEIARAVGDYEFLRQLAPIFKNRAVDDREAGLGIRESPAASVADGDSKEVAEESKGNSQGEKKRKRGRSEAGKEDETEAAVEDDVGEPVKERRLTIASLFEDE